MRITASVYMLMEYLEGKTLATLLEEDFGRGMPMSACLAADPGHLRRLGLRARSQRDPQRFEARQCIHHDLGQGEIARLRHRPRGSRSTRSSVDPGAFGALTPAYASCEMLQGLEPDERDDVYALGCVIYEMLSGKHPFARRSSLRGARCRHRARCARIADARAERRARARARVRSGQADGLDRGALLAQLEPRDKRRAPPLVWLAAGLVLVAAAGGIAWFLARRAAPQQSPSGVAATLAQLGVVQDRARELGVDTGQTQWQAGLRQADAARQSLAAGDPNGLQSVRDAQAALVQVIRSGTRSTELGSTPAEIDLAVRLCRDAGMRCSASDFADEASRTVAMAPFELDQTEVSNRQFGDYVAATGATTEAEHAQGVLDYHGDQAVFRGGASWKTLRDELAAKHGDASDFPVRGIDYNSASKYCEWRHQRLRAAMNGNLSRAAPLGISLRTAINRPRRTRRRQASSCRSTRSSRAGASATAVSVGSSGSGSATASLPNACCAARRGATAARSINAWRRGVSRIRLTPMSTPACAARAALRNGPKRRLNRLSYPKLTIAPAAMLTSPCTWGQVIAQPARLIVRCGA
jgi:hypothetical protein